MAVDIDKKSVKKELANKTFAQTMVYSSIYHGASVKEAVAVAKEVFGLTVDMPDKISKDQAKVSMMRNLATIKMLHATGIIKGSISSWNSIASIEDQASGKSAMQMQKLSTELARKDSELDTVNLKYNKLSNSAVSINDVNIFLEYIASQFFAMINNFKSELSESSQRTLERNIDTMIEAIDTFNPQQIVSDAKHGKDRAQNKKL